MIEKVISGGQIGADIAGLRAAKAAGIKTGGFAPRCFKTLIGPNLNLRTEYGLVQCDQDDYPHRTRMNVFHSDCTIRFAINWNSPGELATIREIKRFNKPYYDVSLLGWEEAQVAIPEPQYIAEWLKKIDARVVNIAGNALVSIELTVEFFLREVFSHDN